MNTVHELTSNTFNEFGTIWPAEPPDSRTPTESDPDAPTIREKPVTAPQVMPPTHRRALLKAAAWTTPAVLAASAAPAYASSTAPRVNLYSLAANATEPTDGNTNAGGFPYYQGERWLDYTVTYGNLGPDAMPAGAIISLGLPHPAIWDKGSITIPRPSGDPLNKTPVAAGNRTEFVTPADGETPAFNRIWFDFEVTTPIPAGQTFQITYRIKLTATRNTSSMHWAVRDFSDISTGTADAVDTQLGNNRNRVEELRMYNPSAQAS